MSDNSDISKSNENNFQDNIDYDEDDFDEIKYDKPILIKKIDKKLEKMKKKEKDEIMKKKRKRIKDKTDITYDSNKKQLIDCFCSNLNKSNNFLINCEKKEIKIDDEENEKNEKKQKNDKNYKNDINDKFDKFDKNDKIDKNKLIKDILKNKTLNPYQKKKLNQLILEIKNMDIKNVIQNQKKLDIIFDLDNTCIFASLFNLEHYEKIKEKSKLKLIDFFYNNKHLYYYIILRNNLFEFFTFAKQFCNFHISTLACEKYGKEIQKILEKDFNIKFNKFQARRKTIEIRKYLRDLNLHSKFTLIFDKNPEVWKNDYLNVIISKRFIDKEVINLKDKGKIKNNFLQIFFPFCYYKSNKIDNEIEWKNQKLYFGKMCPFYHCNENDDYKNYDCYSGEYLDSPKYQFIYMKDIIKIVYYFLFNYDINVSDSLKLIRYNIFYNTYFNLKYYKNDNGDGINILKNIIENCGGQLFEENKYNKINKLFFVCRKEDYLKFKDEIQKEIKIYNNSEVVNDKFILDSFYFMTNLESELNDPEYSFNNDYY